MSTYRATATAEPRSWWRPLGRRWYVVDVEGVGVTQGRGLADAQHMAEDLVRIVTGDERPVVDLVVQPAGEQ